MSPWLQGYPLTSSSGRLPITHPAPAWLGSLLISSTPGPFPLGTSTAGHSAQNAQHTGIRPPSSLCSNASSLLTLQPTTLRVAIPSPAVMIPPNPALFPPFPIAFSPVEILNNPLTIYFYWQSPPTRMHFSWGREIFILFTDVFQMPRTVPSTQQCPVTKFSNKWIHGQNPFTVYMCIKSSHYIL